MSALCVCVRDTRKIRGRMNGSERDQEGCKASLPDLIAHLNRA